MTKKSKSSEIKATELTSFAKTPFGPYDDIVPKLEKYLDLPIASPFSFFQNKENRASKKIIIQNFIGEFERLDKNEKSVQDALFNLCEELDNIASNGKALEIVFDIIQQKFGSVALCTIKDILADRNRVDPSHVMAWCDPHIGGGRMIY